MSTPPGSTVKQPKRASTSYACTECGTSSIRWVGRCPECQAWGTMAEEGVRAAALTLPAPVTPRTAAQPISRQDATLARALPTGIGELDRVLGGGLVPGAVLLLAGEPGVGKSTLLLEAGQKYAAVTGSSALIVTGEESTAQVRARAERTHTMHPQLFLAAENDLGAVLAHLDEVKPGLLILDSVQTIASSTVDGVVGGVPQIRAVTAAISAVAKERGIATVLVGHVTKDGSIAGPRALEHLVDVVLYFEGDRHSSLRLLRAIKNRFGATDEVGCFEMHEEGIDELPDPSGLFVSSRDIAVPGTCVTVTVTGRRPLLSEVQSLVASSYGNGGSARRSVTDLDASRVNMLLAVLGRHAGVQLGDRDVYAASVGGIKITEPSVDLAILLAVASAASDIALPSTLCAIGEVSLSGDIRRVSSVQRRLSEASRLGFRKALVPHGSDWSQLAGMKVVEVPTVTRAWDFVAQL
ncbi:DNA repair protein RadA [Jatrophihabitans sp.]|uniref:DNA repair protein RadA n=1 Tax=Jatrophihabitans sp. TaxID=1932789 RepID=UPI002B5A9DE0|nr:DNA repair protein RadA [Jatrophihabitans sp.]